MKFIQKSPLNMTSLSLHRNTHSSDDINNPIPEECYITVKGVGFCKLKF